MLRIVFAHFGHWYISFPVYMGPPALLAVYLKWSGRREKRKRAAGDEKPSPPAD